MQLRAAPTSGGGLVLYFFWPMTAIKIVLVLVLVLVLDLKRCGSITHSTPGSGYVPPLEGSRFVRLQFYKLIAGGSRKLRRTCSYYGVQIAIVALSQRHT